MLIKENQKVQLEQITSLRYTQDLFQIQYCNFTKNNKIN